jgi:hypothetical protein
MQSSPAFQDRNQSFGTGMNGDQGEAPSPVGSPGLAQAQQQENAAQPHGIRPSLSDNGMSEGTYSSTMGGAFPTSNGMAENQYQSAKYLMRKSY